MFNLIRSTLGQVVEYDMLLLSVVIFLPSVFALGLLVFPSRAREAMRWWATFGSAAAVVASACLLIDFYAMLDSRSDRAIRSLHHPDTLLDARVDEAARRADKAVPEAQLGRDMIAKRPWVPRFDIWYFVGVDGLSMPLIMLTTVITFLAVLASWTIDKHVKAYFMLLLILETGVIGAFMSLDLFLFYVFYEVMLLPMYFLIGMWGGGRRKYAAIKFVIYTLLGSVFILIAMIGLYFTDVRDFVDRSTVEARAAERRHENPKLSEDEASEYHTFDIITLQRAGQAAMLVLTGQTERLTARTGPEKDRGDAILHRDGEEHGKKLSAGDRGVPLLGRGQSVASAQARFSQPFFTSTYQYLFFALLFIGFAVKVPLVPLHSWLPDAHVEAPTPISMVLAGILLKLGGYGIMRLAYPICPWAAEQLALVVGILGAFAIVYGAMVAMGQSDFKKLLAYSSVSHMGYVILGIAVWSTPTKSQYWAWGMNGAMFQMVAHGVTSAGLFFVVGVIYDRAHTREIAKFGGLMESMPLYGGLAAILFFASMGLPGLCGFVGEIFVVLAAWNYQPALAIPAILATILTAGYLLWTWQRVFLGVNLNMSSYPDLTLREAIILIIFVVLAVALGVFPQFLLLTWVEPSVTGLVESLARLNPW
jgi:NADH-quinone oxidoreductase subunit M